jgi:hypothetical protein
VRQKCDALARTLAVRGEVDQKHGIPGILQESGAAKHLGAIGVNAVQKEDGSLAGFAAC